MTEIGSATDYVMASHAIRLQKEHLEKLKAMPQLPPVGAGIPPYGGFGVWPTRPLYFLIPVGLIMGFSIGTLIMLAIN